MDKLPSEILTQIFILLHQKHKLECMTVCKRWEFVIRKTCLFHTILMTRVKQLKSLQKRLKDDPDNGATQVVTFISFMGLGWEFHSSILGLFPNPQFICLPFGYLEDYMSENWSHHLEYLYSDEILASQLIGSYNNYPRLKGIYTRKLKGQKYPDEFISSLQSTRVLKQLTLDDYCITLSDIEMAHEYATVLESIYLMNTHLPEQQEEILDILARDIEPATSVTTFTLDIDRLVSPEDASNFLIYVSRKYPNLQNFRITSLFYGLYDDFLELIYSDGFLPLISRLGPTLQNISTCLITPTSLSDFFKALDDSKCKIQGLTIEAETYTWDLSSFQGSEQLKYIQTLKLENLKCTHFHWLSHFIVLKQLSLCFLKKNKNQMSVQLNEILQFCQDTVETILLQDVRLTCKPSKDIQLPSLKRLDLLQIVLCDNTDIFISTALPYLRHLKLLYYGNLGIHFHFPSTNFFCLDIQHLQTELSEVLKVETVGGRQHFYAKSKFDRHQLPVYEHIIKYDEEMYPANELWNHVASFDDPTITIECSSFKNVLF